MNSNMERVWIRLKSTAKSLAESGKSISYRRARSIVAILLREEFVDMTRSEVLDYLTNELINHIAQYEVAVMK